tara:strand:+ start:72 stop:554 length:483 start_codon:yes stop_codon:yes gene_type:complete
MTSLKANEILKNKFWIIEDTDSKTKVGTLSKDQDNRFMYSCDTGSYFYDNKNAVEKELGYILWTKGDITDKASPSKEIYNLPTSTTPYNTMYDIKRKFGLFTKSKKSKSLYCAGYFCIHFEKGWVKSFCPKLVTLEKYEYKGPFKTELEMRQELSNVNRN